MLCALIGLSYGYWKAYVDTIPRYRASAQMALVTRSEQVVNLQEVIGGVSRDERSMNTELSVIRSRELIGQLVDRLGLIEDPEFNPYLIDPLYRPSLIQRLRDLRYLVVDRPVRGPLPALEEQRRATIDRTIWSISTSSQPASYIFNITATTRNPVKSAQFANTMAEIYYNDQIARKVEATENATAWLSERVGELRIELEGRQAEIAAQRGESTLASEEAVSALSAQSLALQTRLVDTRRDLSQLTARSEALEAATTREEIVTAAADSQLSILAQSLDAGQSRVQAQFDRRLLQVQRQFSVEIERAKTQISELEDLAADLALRIEAQSGRLLAIRQLEQETETTRALYETFLGRLKEMAVQEGTLQADSRIISRATPGGLITARASRTMLQYILLTTIVGAGLVLLREFLQNGYRTADDLEAETGYPVFGQIPKIPARTRKSTITYLLEKPTSAAAEAIRNLRTSVLLSNVDQPPQLIMSTSSIPGEGKTTLAISLAQNLAGLNKKVLMIEGDIRRRTFNAYFPEAADKAGLLSVISGEVPFDKAVYRAEKLRVDVIMGEKTSVNAADVFSSDAFRTFLTKMRAEYDYIIIDTPPVLVVPDARVVGQLADTIIYSVKWDKTSKLQVKDGLSQLQSVNADVSGLALSQIDPVGMKRYGYAGRYGAYSKYGKSYYDS